MTEFANTLVLMIAIAPFVGCYYWPLQGQNLLRIRPAYLVVGYLALILEECVIISLFIAPETSISDQADTARRIYNGFLLVHILIMILTVRLALHLRLYLAIALAIVNLSVINYALVITGLIVPHHGLLQIAVFGAMLTILSLLAGLLYRLYLRDHAASLIRASRIWGWGWVPCQSFLILDLGHLPGPGDDISATLGITTAILLALGLYLRFIAWFLNDVRGALTLRQRTQLRLRLREDRRGLQELSTISGRAERIRDEHVQNFLDRLHRGIVRHDTALVRQAIESARREILDSLNTTTYCQGQLLNALFVSACLRARKLGFNPLIRISLPVDLEPQSPDLCALIGSLLDNAIEACEHLPFNQRWITCDARCIGDQLAILLNNSCDSGQIRRSSGSFLSTKRGFRDLGLGLANARYIVNKYNGTMKLEQAGNTFSVSVMLGLKGPAGAD